MVPREKGTVTHRIEFYTYEEMPLSKKHSLVLRENKTIAEKKQTDMPLHVGYIMHGNYYKKNVGISQQKETPPSTITYQNSNVFVGKITYSDIFTPSGTKKHGFCFMQTARRRKQGIRKHTPAAVFSVHGS